LRAAQTAFGCHLIGGDTDRTPGPLTLTVAALGEVPSGTRIARSGAQAGDAIVVTGTIGDASLGLRLRQDLGLAARAGLDAAAIDHLAQRFARPLPILAVAALVRHFANAALDVSDGLAKDLSRLAAVSGVGASIEMARMPISAPARRLLEAGLAKLEDLVAGGEDYEVLMTVSAERYGDLEREAAAAGIGVAKIGEIEAGREVVWRTAAGVPINLGRTGFDHF
jgi:thiamine-monophosphate kinase